MRILLLGTGIQPIPPTGYGGVERTIAEYARALRAAGHEPQIVQQVRRRRSIDEYWFARTLPRLLAPTSYDVLHASTPVVANRLAGMRRPFVYTSHSRHWFERDRLGARWGYFLEKRAVGRSAATVALTERLRDRMRRDVARPPAELVTIPIGVDTDRFRPDRAQRTGHVALGVGVIAPFKRWELAAAALKGSGAELRVVGPIADPSYAERLRSAGDRVTLLGEIDDERLRAEYAHADLYVHPSRVELLAGVVLQALSAGLPVIGASPVAGLAEEGVSGWSAPEGADEVAITEFLRGRAADLLGDPGLRARMSDAARLRAQRAFSWESVVAAHLALYERLGRAGALNRR